jgi:hypothetical protein
VFFATLVRSTFGFGEALIAVPLLALVIPIEIAAPVAVLLSITIAAVAVAEDWRKIHLRSTPVGCSRRRWSELGRALRCWPGLTRVFERPRWQL